MTMAIAETLAGVAQRLGLTLIFKASFDKANRSSDQSFRGLGMSKGLQILDKVRRETGLAVITDVHEAGQVDEVAAVVDVLQTPAFLARQTDFIAAVAASGKPVNIKKAQFMAPADMQQVVNKARNAARAAGHDPDAFLLCERGTSFGYNTLVSDMRGLAIMAETGCPVVFDATHSVQQPGGLGERSGGQREFVPLLARAAVAAGVAGVFMETHPDPDQALSDGPNALPLGDFEELWKRLMAIDAVVKQG
ncbi:3-deoxy-8-phosphooctulonate synthase [Novosphingobium pokkalii]